MEKSRHYLTILATRLVDRSLPQMYEEALDALFPSGPVDEVARADTLSTVCSPC